MEDTSTAVAEAPSSSPSSTPSAAPASTPASEPTVTTNRPSMGESLKLADQIVTEHQRKGKRAAAPAPDGTIPPPEGTPTGEVVPQATSQPGPVPTPVHIKAVENARLKGRQEAEQEFRSSVGDPAVAREALQWFNNAAQDRGGFLRGVINEALADPQMRAEILSIAGSTLGGNRQPQQAAPPSGIPSPDYQDPTTGTKFYSADAMGKVIEQIKADILSEVQPDLDQVRSEREQRQVEANQRQALGQIQSHVNEAKKLPYFDQFKAQIADVARAMPMTTGHPAEEAIVLQRAYWQVVGPQLSQLEQQRVLADLKSRANASSLNPASTGAPSGIPKNVRAKDGGTFGNALRWAMDQQAR